MNAKQTAPLVVTLAPLATAIAPVIPVVLIGGAAYFVLKWLWSDDEDSKPTVAPANSEANNSLKSAESPVIRQIPAEIPAKPNVIPAAPAIIPPASVPPVPKASALAPAPQKIMAEIPLLAKKKFVTREDLAKVFNHGARSLNRTAAVAALKGLGFGKSAAYAALEPDGRFSAWLQCAPDGIISWTDGHTV